VSYQQRMFSPRSLCQKPIAATSLLVFLAAIFLWCRSRNADDRFHFSGSLSGVMVVSSDGILSISQDFYNKFPILYGDGSPGPTTSLQRIAGIGLNRIHCQQWDHIAGRAFQRDFDQFWISYRSIALLSAIFPVFQMARRWVSRPVLSTACESCGYDLRASPDACPECGTASPHRFGHGHLYAENTHA
jgi:hypothetical protein